MTKLIAAFALSLAVAAPSIVVAYKLPDYRMSDEDRQAPCEEVLSKYDSYMKDVSSSVDVARIDRHRSNSKVRLSKKERDAMERLDGLKRSHTFWNYTCNLKHDLVGLFGNNSTQEARDEADRIAKAVIEELYAISQRYDIAASALIQNFLINVGAKEKGRCYHYVSDLRAALSGVPMKQFELYWGEAFAGTFRENNALVISVKGKTFGDGIAIDAWRSAGKPFWTPVRGDRFPWKEAPNIAYE